eukprot:NODE_26235_length_558_cov_5.227378.p1 GENE.NODE_26235_length_558_cov_5.227378~~NODE_26235_length_558_cov_5.227378.p1  ORF type:complete len:116 (-),score=28.04 NODE_26235_length_558_cov_5.227378:188-535(-)
MSLRRAIVRVNQTAALLRKTTARDCTRLGSYPVPPEASVLWKNRFQVPGGQIQQSMSPYQQKIMWQYFWNYPARWYWRFSKWAWPVGVPCLIVYVFIYRSCKADVEADIRAKAWW